MQALPEYASLPEDLVSNAKRWREWAELTRPEEDPLPGDWKRMPEFDRLLVFKCAVPMWLCVDRLTHALTHTLGLHRVMRPDRLTAAIRKYVGRVLGPDFVKSQAFNLARSCANASPSIPVFVFLSPGVDVAAAVEALGAVHGMTADAGKYCSVSLGQVRGLVNNVPVLEEQKKGVYTSQGVDC